MAFNRLTENAACNPRRWLSATILALQSKICHTETINCESFPAIMPNLRGGDQVTHQAIRSGGTSAPATRVQAVAMEADGSRPLIQHMLVFICLSILVAAVATLTGCGGDEPAAQAPARPSYSNYSYQEEQRPQRPENVNEWTNEHFLSAKQENDPKLAEAVRAYGEKHVGQPQAVSLLVQLLTKQEAADANAGGYGGGGYSSYGYGNSYDSAGGDSEPGPAIVRALVINDTEEARLVLNNVLAGNISTVMEENVAVSEVLRHLAENQQPENNAILFAVATMPEQFRAGGGTGENSDPTQDAYGYGNSYGYGDESRPVIDGSVTAASMQQFALELFSDTADRNTRTQLAHAALGRHATGASSGSGMLGELPPVPSGLKSVSRSFSKTGSAIGRLLRFPGMSSDAAKETADADAPPDGQQAAAGQTDGTPALTAMANPLSAAPMVTPESRAAIIQFLSRPHPDNLEAQMLLYQDEAFIDPAVREVFDSIFLAQSSSALQRLMGLSLASGAVDSSANDGGYGYGAGYGEEGYGYGNQTQGAPVRQGGAEYGYGAADAGYGYSSAGEFVPIAETDMTQEQASAIAQSLWDRQFVQNVVDQMPENRLVEPNLQTLLFASTMPVQPVRDAFAVLLDKYHTDAPDLLSQVGVFEQAMSDPGLLVQIKPYARLADQETRRVPDVRARRDERTGGYGDDATQTENEDQPAIEQFVRALNRRFAAAEPTRFSTGEFPFDIPDGAQISAQYRLDWSSGQTPDGVAVAPLAVYYAKLEQHIEAYKLQGFYRRKVYKPTIHNTEQLYWVEGLENVPDRGMVRSVDIMVSRPGTDQAGGQYQANRQGGYGENNAQTETNRRARQRPEPEDFTVEILIVEAPRPPEQVAQN